MGVGLFLYLLGQGRLNVICGEVLGDVSPVAASVASVDGDAFAQVFLDGRHEWVVRGKAEVAIRVSGRLQTAGQR